MSLRARYILAIVILAVVIIAAGLLIFFFGARTSTFAPGLRESGTAGVPIIDRNAILAQDGALQGLTGDLDIDWLGNCTSSHDPSLPSSYDAPVGTGFSIQFTCENLDPSTAHSLEVRSFDARAYVFEVPTEGCRDQNTKQQLGQGATWPPAINSQVFPTYTDLVTWMSKWWWSAPGNNETCASLPQTQGNPPYQVTNIQDLQYPGTPDNTQTIPVAVGQSTIAFTTPHSFDVCDWYQYDDLLIDPVTQDGELWMGAARRAFGTIGGANCAAGATLGNLEIRMWQEVDDLANPEYSTPTAGGTDIPLANKTVKLLDASGTDVTAQCDNGRVVTGGAGRLSCFQIPVGKYTVQVIDSPTGLNGPLVDTHNNPAPGEKHNAAGVEDLELTVVPGPQPQGGSNDIVTYFDFGYAGLQAALGNLEIRMWEEIDNLNDPEYTTPTAGGTDSPFAGETVKLLNASGTDVTAQCDNGRTVTGGAGRLSCFQIATGRYTVQVSNPDDTLYAGPLVDDHDNPATGEKHNAAGTPPAATENLTLTVVPGPAPQGVGNDIVTYFDFGYRKKFGPIVAGAQPCTIDKSVTDQTPADEGTPDDLKTSKSAQGEQLLFTIAYDCTGNSTGNAVISDDYDDKLVTVTDSSITNNGVHDKTLKLVTWTIPLSASNQKGTVSFKATVNSGLAAGTYTSPNLVTISLNNQANDQDTTTTTIVVTATSTPTTPPTTPTTAEPTVPTSTGTPARPTEQTRTPETGINAQTWVLLASLVAAIGLASFTLLRAKPGYSKK
jgi:hypothetical protein